MRAQPLVHSQYQILFIFALPISTQRLKITIKLTLASKKDTGKSSLSKILVGYATRAGRKIIYVDLDVGQGLITIPGMIAAVQASRPYGVDEGYSAPPLVYFYGHTSMNDNVECYKKQVSTLMKQLDNMHATPDCKISIFLHLFQRI